MFLRRDDGVSVNSVLSSQLLCNPKTALKNMLMNFFNKCHRTAHSDSLKMSDRSSSFASSLGMLDLFDKDPRVMFGALSFHSHIPIINSFTALRMLSFPF